MEKNRSYYERRFDFLATSLTNGTISRNDLVINGNGIVAMMGEYAHRYGTSNSTLSFTVLQDIIGSLNREI